MTLHRATAANAVTRRMFLKTGGAALGAGLVASDFAPGSSLASAAPVPTGRRNCILLFLCGGPSHLETWDPKPDAPSDIRGPFGAIRTAVPGVSVSEHFPLLAQRLNQVALVRSLHHGDSPIHETGHQLLHTGHLFRGGIERPAIGAHVNRQYGLSDSNPQYVVLPGPLGNTGVSVPHGQDAGVLGKDFDPRYLDAATAADRLLLPQGWERSARRYGATPFGRNCYLAARLVEQGTRFVTVNMFDTVFGKVTWDCHANGGDLGSTFDDYRNTLCPQFDLAFTSLLDDMAATGLLDDTLLVATGEFGRTPILNRRGGRDHWAGVWTGLVAGGLVRGGQVIGSSDSRGMEPSARPVHLSELAAMMAVHCGVHVRLAPQDAESNLGTATHAEPIRELFA